MLRKIMKFRGAFLLLVSIYILSLAISVSAETPGISISPDKDTGAVSVTISSSSSIKDGQISLVCYSPQWNETDFDQANLLYLDQYTVSGGSAEINFKINKAVESGEYFLVIGSAEGKFIEPFNFVTTVEPTNPDQEAADAVKAKIDAIGAVTLNSKSKIEEARKAYNALSTAAKQLVGDTYLSRLESAEKAYAKVVEENTPLKAGTDIKDSSGKLKYKVLKPATAKTKGTVEVTGLAKASLKKITIPAEVRSGNFRYKVVRIKKNAFKNNKNLTSVNIKNNVTTIGVNAFSRCSKLITVKIGNGIKTINKSAFAGSRKLKKVTIKGKKVRVNKNAFKGIAKNVKIKLATKKLTKKYATLLKKGPKKTVTVKI